MLSNQSDSLTPEQSAEKDEERRKYKYIFERWPNPNDKSSDICAWAEWEKERINNCIEMRAKWDAKWKIKHNPQVYSDLTNRLRSIEKYLTPKNAAKDVNNI